MVFDNYLRINTHQARVASQHTVLMMTNKLKIDPGKEINKHLKADKEPFTELLLIVCVSHGVVPLYERCFCKQDSQAGQGREGDTSHDTASKAKTAGEKLSLRIIMITRLHCENKTSSPLLGNL